MGGVKRDFSNIFFRIVIPTILFSSLLYLPKTIFHSSGIVFSQYLFDVWGGISFWFTSALTVAEISLLLFFLFIPRNIWVYTILTFLVFVIGIHFSNSNTNMSAAAYFPWFYRTGLIYTFIMVLGGIYQRFEQSIDKHIRFITPTLFIAYIAIIRTTWNGSFKMLGVGGRCDLPGFFILLCGILFIVYATKKLQSYSLLNFIGKNSLIFYFLSGCLPAAFGSIIGKLCPNGSYSVVILVTLFSAASACGVTWFIARFMPFLTDFRLLRDNGKQQK